MIQVIKKTEIFLQTVRGQQFLQYAYSFGAAIVIFGAMVKVLHLWGIWGNIIFATGMTIECIVFVLYGLDRPASVKENRNEKSYSLSESGNDSGHSFHGIATHTAVRQMPSMESLQQSHADNPEFTKAVDALNRISGSLEEAYRHIVDNSHDVSQNTLGYVRQMEALNRNISGLNTIYEIQLKSISGQLDAIGEINEGLNRVKSMYNDAIPDSSLIKRETEKMAEQLRELNRVYARMLDAMTNSPVSRTS